MTISLICKDRNADINISIQLLLLRRIPRPTPPRPLPLRFLPKLRHNTPHILHSPILPFTIPNTHLHPHSSQTPNRPPRPLLPRHRLRRWRTHPRSPIPHPRKSPPPQKHCLESARRIPRNKRFNPPRCPSHGFLRALRQAKRKETILCLKLPILKSRLPSPRLPLPLPPPRPPPTVALQNHACEIPFPMYLDRETEPGNLRAGSETP